MIQSMTGFGRGESMAAGRRIAAEIKSVNHRYSEIQIKLPKRYGALEERLKQYLAASMSRGKVDVYIKAEYESDVTQEIRVDKGLALKYHDRIRDLAQSLGVPMDLGAAALIGLPGVLAVDEAEEEIEEVWGLLLPPVDRALAQALEMRKAEGGRLAEDFRRRLGYMEELRQSLLAYAAGVVESYRQRLTARITELMGKQPVDESRLAQEVAMFADKAGVDEELVRLDSHFTQFRELLEDGQPVGRKLDFLCQEMHREINTIGSKANDLAMTKVTVEMKSELEKLREQVQNIQ
ncbi:MAG: YicC family protein [Clostridiales bacterium]|nr:YicC family protein [Clostridiales bacterium]